MHVSLPVFPPRHVFALSDHARRSAARSTGGAAPSDRCGGGRRWPPPPPPCPATPPPGTPAAGIPGRRAVPAGPRSRPGPRGPQGRTAASTHPAPAPVARPRAQQAPHRPAHTGRPKLVPTFRGSARAQQKVKGVPVGVGSGRTTARRGYGSADGSGVALSGNVRRERGRPSVRPASARTVDGGRAGEARRPRRTSGRGAAAEAAHLRLRSHSGFLPAGPLRPAAAACGTGPRRARPPPPPGAVHATPSVRKVTRRSRPASAAAPQGRSARIR